jgi:hypothetical protein
MLAATLQTRHHVMCSEEKSVGKEKLVGQICVRFKWQWLSADMPASAGALHTRHIPWCRCPFFCSQNWRRRELTTRRCVPLHVKVQLQASLISAAMV